jgi:hypothetical protein
MQPLRGSVCAAICMAAQDAPARPHFGGGHQRRPPVSHPLNPAFVSVFIAGNVVKNITVQNINFLLTNYFRKHNLISNVYRENML